MKIFFKYVVFPILLAIGFVLTCSGPVEAHGKTVVFETTGERGKTEMIDGEKVCTYESVFTGREVYWRLSEMESTTYPGTCRSFLFAEDFG